MRLMSIAAAAIMAVAVVASAPDVSAASKSDPTMGGRFCNPGDLTCTRWRPRPRHHYHNNFWFYWGYPHYGYYRPWPYYGNPYYDDDYPVANRMTCNYARHLMQRRGYRSVHATDCSGSYYGFTGIKKGHKYRIRLNAYTGRYSIRLIW